MKIVDYCIHQPVTVAVGVDLSVLAGIMALASVPVQMNPEVDSVVISATTRWESASAEEIESDIIEEQEKVLGDIAGLTSLTSNSQAGQGTIRLEFATGTDIDEAQAEVLQKLDEVPGYPEGVLRPVVEDIDPESVDYIAWIGLSSTDPDFDTTTLHDFMERRMKPQFDRLSGISQVGMRGSREAEIQVRVDPVALAQRGITYQEFVNAIRLTNENFSAGKLPEGKRDVRVRTTGRFEGTAEVLDMVIRRDESGPVRVRDVAEVVKTWKEKLNWARARGNEMPFFNFQLQRGANLIETMDAIQAEVAKMNSPDGVLAQHSRELGLNGHLELVQTYDATTYVKDAISLVQSNIVVGGVLATLTLLFFLRSLRTVGIIGIAIPISVIGSIVVLVGMGRSVNIISLAGVAFAVGMVVDNAIVVIENIYRHLEMGKSSWAAASHGTTEVAGAVVASTMTTLVVFFPILLIQETAGQLFKDIAYAIMAAVSLSLIVSLTVIPSAAARMLHLETKQEVNSRNAFLRFLDKLTAPLYWLFDVLPRATAGLVRRVNRSWTLRIAVIIIFTLGTAVGIKVLLPPADYLPKGNRNVVFGLLIPPPGYNLEQLSEMGDRIEAVVRPSWEAQGPKFQIERDRLERGEFSTTDERVKVPAMPGQEPTVTPPPLEHYFLVSFEDRLFQVAISADKRRVSDAIPLLNHAASGFNTPDTIAFSFQFPLFRVGGNTGSAINIDMKGRDLDEVSNSAMALMFKLMGEFGPYTVNPDPANFALPSTEVQVVPNEARLRRLGMSPTDVGLAVQANGDGILLFREFEQEGELRDLKIISQSAVRDREAVDAIMATPMATPDGQIVDLRTMADVKRVLGPSAIRHVDRDRAVTLQFTPPPGLPLETAIDSVNRMVGELREGGAIPQSVDVKLAGSASKLDEIMTALLGDGTIRGLATSSLFLAFLVVYLVMVVLFQSWTYPVVMILTVPLATFGGFLGLAIVHFWSLNDPYMPVQNLDMLTILGFVILAGVVVNNAILIVHQTLNFLHSPDHNAETPDQAIVEAVRSRVRPILMATLTSVGGMLPLVVLPGSGSELYRGLGAVVVGGLVVSTVFTLVLVPSVLSVVFAFFDPRTHTGREQDPVLEPEPATATPA